MENFIRRLESIPIMQLPIHHRADFRRLCELAYTEYYILFVTQMMRAMSFHDLKPQSGKEGNGGVKTTDEPDKTSTECGGKLFGLTIQECTALMCVATACSAAMLKMSDTLEERKLRRYFRPQSGMEAMRESLDQPEDLDNEGSKSVKTEPEQQGKQLLMKLTTAQPARQLSNVDNIAGLNLQVQAVTAKSGMFRCTHNNIK
jgi:hypothetical protein